jgi:hypothetical protein
MPRFKSGDISVVREGAGLCEIFLLHFWAGKQVEVYREAAQSLHEALGQALAAPLGEDKFAARLEQAARRGQP